MKVIFNQVKAATSICSLLVFSLFISMGTASAAQTANSTDFNLSNYKGQFVYLDFWASWCGPCRASFPWMNTLQKDLKDKNLKIVSINLDAERDDADEFLKEFPADFEVIYDPKGKSAENYKLLGMPSSFFFDPNGKLLFSHIGFNHKDAPALSEKIKAAINAYNANASKNN